MYKLIWRGEEIECDLLMNEAIKYQREYEMAYGGTVRIVKQYEKRK